jgi:hypothetical protein
MFWPISNIFNRNKNQLKLTNSMHKKFWLRWKMEIDGKIQEGNVDAPGRNVGHNQKWTILISEPEPKNVKKGR